ncbi:MAG: LuxR C-terminal-related transcriptional regulator [Bacteroidota bacterium]
MSKIRILIIEDNRLLRESIVAMIGGQTDMNVVAASVGNENIVVRAHALKAQVALLDLGLEDHGRARVVASFAKGAHGVKVIGMGMTPEQAGVVELVQAGASGFILKDATAGDFLATIRSVAKGGKVLPQLLTHSLFSHVVQSSTMNGKAHQNNGVQVTKREREIIALIAEGMSNKDIAGRLNIATHTVKSHVHNILEKMTLQTRLQIAKHSHEGAFN